jgi:hypothetical protein
MTGRHTRRCFLRTAVTAGAAFGLGDVAALGPLGPANADEVKVTPDLVRFGPGIEPVVRLIEETPEDECVAVMVAQLVSAEWRPHLLASAVYSFWGSDRPDNPVMERVRDAVRGLLRL